MSSRVTPRARTRGDHEGDPLDGLVNLFDIGIVLSLAFLLSALASMQLEGALTGKPSAATAKRQVPVVVERDQRLNDVKLERGQRVAGEGTRAGSVYRLSDGRLVYVESK